MGVPLSPETHRRKKQPGPDCLECCVHIAYTRAVACSVDSRRGTPNTAACLSRQVFCQKQNATKPSHCLSATTVDTGALHEVVFVQHHRNTRGYSKRRSRGIVPASRASSTDLVGNILTEICRWFVGFVRQGFHSECQQSSQLSSRKEPQLLVATGSNQSVASLTR